MIYLQLFIRDGNDRFVTGYRLLLPLLTSVLGHTAGISPPCKGQLPTGYHCPPSECTIPYPPPPPQLAVKMSWSPKKRRNLSTHLSSYIRTRLSSRSSVPRNFRFAGPPILDKKVRHRQLFLSIAKSTNLENAHIHDKNMFCSNKISFLYERGL